jgi:phosphatidylserine/phosphatidylglycerophosphate/cardiolipin synthase-like enzyme
VYVEVAGPAVADVHHNYVQRWNEASERARDDGRWGERGDGDLDYPTHTPRARGDVVVQMQRTTHAGRYADRHPPPGASPYPIELGERTNLDQYRAAIRAARRTIYLEHQFLEVAEIISALDDALTRGVSDRRHAARGPGTALDSIGSPRTHRCARGARTPLEI